VTEWIEVLKVLVDGPRLPVRGVVRTVEAELIGKTETFGFIGCPPLPVAIDGHDVRVWRHGLRVRVERPDGTPYFITDGDTAWRFAEESGARPTYVAADRVYYNGPGSELLITRDSRDWLQGDDFTRPTGPISETVFLGRDCWEVELAPPPHKEHPLQLVIDVASGAVLQQRSDAFAMSVSFTEIQVGGAVDDSLFAWGGSADSLDELRAAERTEAAAADEVLQSRRRAWFAQNVSDPEMTVSLQVGLSISAFYELDQTEGSFYASLSSTLGWQFSGILARRVRRADKWELHSGRLARHWSTASFDWACWLNDAPLDDDTLAQLQRHLHPGETPTSQFTESS
jgi:hypothetical protein